MKKNLKILILIGVPAAGKSSWSKEFVRQNENWTRVSRDDFREMLKSAGRVENKVEEMINELTDATITQALLKKMNVIIDNTNLKAKYIQQIVDKFKYSADIDYRIFDISKDKAIERDRAREKSVGVAVINRMYEDYKVLIDSFDFQPVSKVKSRPNLVPDFSSNKQPAVIFDIDGTIALMGRRSPFDWMQVYKDDLNQIVSEQLTFHKSQGRKILIVTGRDEVCRDVTLEWLDMYGIEHDELFMRPKDDGRKDVAIKREIYLRDIKPNYNVLCAYDDRLAVCRAWSEMGVFVFTVNQGLIDF